jgi:hypothetical protein
MRLVSLVEMHPCGLVCHAEGLLWGDLKVHGQWLGIRNQRVRGSARTNCKPSRLPLAPELEIRRINRVPKCFHWRAR